jgi:hypothetical protein
MRATRGLVGYPLWARHPARHPPNEQAIAQDRLDRQEVWLIARRLAGWLVFHVGRYSSASRMFGSDP